MLLGVDAMRRFITEELIKWKESKTRKPLILKGARQVGKTYILKEFGKNNYENVVYFNFDHDDGLSDLFLNTKNPIRIIEQLSLVNGKKINPETTLIIFGVGLVLFVILKMLGYELFYLHFLVCMLM